MVFWIKGIGGYERSQCDQAVSANALPISNSQICIGVFVADLNMVLCGDVLL